MGGVRAKVILADPPWRYRNFSDSKQGAAASAMETMSASEICGLAPVVKNIADIDCVLGLWGTWPKVPEALEVLNAWGFTFVTGFPWVKMTLDGNRPKPGVGYWVRGTTEYMLIGRRGKPKRVSERNRTPAGLLVGEPGVFYAPKGSVHSEKPVGIHAWFEEMFGDVPRVELFARKDRPGWICYGLDLGYRILPHAIVSV